MSTYGILYYIAYPVGGLAFLYSVILLARYILMSYIIKAIKGKMANIPNADGTSYAGDSALPYEDEHFRDQENELFHEEIAKLPYTSKKKQPNTDMIEVSPEKIGGTVNYGDVFSEGEPRLQATIEKEVIVGIAMPGRLANILLGKKQKEFINTMFYNLQKEKGIESTKWRDFVTTRREREVFKGM